MERRADPFPDLKRLLQLGASKARRNGEVEVGEGGEEQDGVGLFDHLGPAATLRLLAADINDLEGLLLELDRMR